MICDDPDTIAANSFRNFHAKGLDYLCLHRSEALTIKAYFYSGNIGADVVCPHDHRYPFSTHILAGTSAHYRYEDVSPRLDGSTALYQCFDYLTPLNGGNGFTWRNEICLRTRRQEYYGRGKSYWCEADEIHTIAILEPDTVLLLYQHSDVYDIDRPTQTFVPGFSSEPPSLTGLYDRMPLDYAQERLRHVSRLMGL